MVTTIGGFGEGPLLGLLGPDDEGLRQQARKEFKAGTVIFSEGDLRLLLPPHVGQVRRTSRRPRPGADGYAATDSLETKVQSWMPTEEYLHAGDYFGTSAILGSGQRTRHSTLTAVTDVSVVALSKDDFEIDGTDGERRLSSGYAAPGAGSGSGARRASRESRRRRKRRRRREISGAAGVAVGARARAEPSLHQYDGVDDSAVVRGGRAAVCGGRRGRHDVHHQEGPRAGELHAPRRTGRGDLAARRRRVLRRDVVPAAEAAQRDGRVRLGRRLRGTPRLAR